MDDAGVSPCVRCVRFDGLDLRVSHILSWQGSEGSQPSPMATVEDWNLAIVSGSSDQLKEVLNSGIDPDAADVFGNTPLRSIIGQSGRVPVSHGQVEILLAAGRIPTCRMNTGTRLFMRLPLTPLKPS